MRMGREALSLNLELFAPTVELHRLISENRKSESEYKQLEDSLKLTVLTTIYTTPSVTEVLSDVIVLEKVLFTSEINCFCLLQITMNTMAKTN